MAEIAAEIMDDLRDDAPLVHEDTSGTLPAARLATDGEHGDPAASETEASVVAYVPALSDDAAQWHPISDLISAIPSTTLTGGTFTPGATSLTVPDLADPGWLDLSEAVLGGGTGRLTVSASVPLSLDSPGNTLRTASVRLLIDGYPTTAQTATMATDSTAGNTTTITFSAATYSIPLLNAHRIRVQIDRPAGDAASTIYTSGVTITATVAAAIPITLAGDVTGLSDANTVVALRGRTVSTVVPDTGDALVWSGAEWVPSASTNPITDDGDMIYGYGYVPGAPGSNTALPGLLTLTTTTGTVGGALANVIDGNDTTFWGTTSLGNFRLDFGAVPPVTRGWRVLQSSSTTYQSTGIILEGSNDGTAYTTLDTWTPTGAKTDSGVRAFAADANYRYYRYRSTGSGIGGWRTYTAELFLSTVVLASPTRLPIGTEAQVLTVASGVPVWSDATGGSGTATQVHYLARNTTATTIPKHSIVYLKGSSGLFPTIELALATGNGMSAKTIGWTETDIAPNDNGYVHAAGLLTGVNTNGYADGVTLFLSETTAGATTSTRPVAPYHGVVVGVVIKGGSVGAGEVMVWIQNGFELNELHDVYFTNPPTNGDVLGYDTAATRWTKLAAGGDITGAYGDTTVTGLQGNPVSATAPTTDDNLVFNGTTWEPVPAVLSVDGRTGDVTLDDLYLTPAEGDAAYILQIEKGSPLGVATLDAFGKLTASEVPAIAITNTFVVSSQALMLGLTTAETGDIAVRTDVSKSFILTATPPSTLANWQELLTPTDTVQSVDGRTGFVTLSDLYVDVGGDTMTGGLAVTPGAGTIPLSITTPSGSTADAINATIGGTANRFRVDQFGSVYGVSMRGASNGKFGSQTSNYTSVLDVTPTGAAQIGAVTRGRVSQTADLAQWQDNSGTVMAKVTAAGAIDATTLTQAGTAVVITTDARLTDARTPTAHATTHELGGSDELGLSPAQVIGTAVIDSDTRLTDARTPTDAAYGAMEAMLFGKANTAATHPVTENVSASAALSSGHGLVVGFRPMRDLTIDQMSTFVTSAGSGTTLFKMGLYTVDLSTTVAMTRVAATVSGTPAVGMNVLALDTTGGLPASYTLVAGAHYAMLLLWTGTTGPAVMRSTQSLNIDYQSARRLQTQALGYGMASSIYSSLTDIPASLGGAGGINTARPWMRLE